jgi:hypothetical protein
LHPPETTTSSQLNFNDAVSDAEAAGVAATVSALGSGQYAVSYTVTRSGWYYIRGKLTQTGGLYAVYMENTLFVEGGDSAIAQPPAQRVDSVVDFDWGAKSPLDSWSPGLLPDLFAYASHAQLLHVVVVTALFSPHFQMRTWPRFPANG